MPKSSYLATSGGYFYSSSPSAGLHQDVGVSPVDHELGRTQPDKGDIYMRLPVLVLTRIMHEVHVTTLSSWADFVSHNARPHFGQQNTPSAAVLFR